MDQLLTQLTATHISLYKAVQEKIRYFYAPGRVNLIGEHTDYNGGYVFPCALDIGTYATVSLRNDNQFHIYSQNFPDKGILEFSLDNLDFNAKHSWANYPKGIIKEFITNGAAIKHGLEITYYGNLPNGAGLSSSASIEVLTGIILNSYFHANFDPIKIALIGQATENNYIGVGCGIMDQFASAMGKRDHAILLDCNTLSYQYAPLDLTGYKLIIGNTNKRRGLADSKYNERLHECQRALKILQQSLPITALGEIDLATFHHHQSSITDPTILKRARHTISENERTKAAAQALSNNDLAGFGKLMNQSHQSLRDDYEVTGFELDSMVAAAWAHPACLGSRMTGAGFGGCTISLVKEEQATSFIEEVNHKYHTATNLHGAFYIVSAADGARELKG